MTQQRIKYLRDNKDDWYHNKVTEWHDGYKAGKVQKAQIKKELLPISWHPSRYWDWCMSEGEKKGREQLFLTT